MSIEDNAVERAKGLIMEQLDFDDPVPYLKVWEMVAAETNWKSFQRAIKELKASGCVSNFGGLRKKKAL